MKKIRVLNIVDTLNVSCGVCTIVMNLFKHIKCNDIYFDFMVCKTAEESYEKEILEKGSLIYHVGNPLAVTEHISAICKIESFFKEHSKEYDVVHLHSPTLAEFTLKYAKKYGIPHRIVHSHSTVMSTNKVKTVINNFLIQRIKKYATDYWACSTEAAKFLYGDKFCNLNRVELIKNAIDTSMYRFSEEKYIRVREKYNLGENIVITHISNFSYIKNHMFLIDVINECVSKKDKLIFVFVGDGPAKAEFEKKINEEGLSPNVIFVGRKKDVADFYAMSDLVILPSLKEGLPLTVVEAQAGGVPCYISDTITTEANVGGVKYLPIEKSIWVKELLEFTPLKKEERERLSRLVEESFFNIIREAQRVKNLYVELLKE